NVLCVEDHTNIKQRRFSRLILFVVADNVEFVIDDNVVLVRKPWDDFAVARDKHCCSASAYKPVDCRSKVVWPVRITVVHDKAVSFDVWQRALEAPTCFDFNRTLCVDDLYTKI